MSKQAQDTGGSYIQHAPNGDWLVLQIGAQDRLLGTFKTRREAIAFMADDMSDIDRVM